MRAGLTRVLAFVLAAACVLPQVGCGAAPPAAGSPGPAAVPAAQPQRPPTVDEKRALPVLRLDPLFADRPRPPEDVRNPFRFGPTREATARRAVTDVTPSAQSETPAAQSPTRAEPTATPGPVAPGVNGASLRLVGVVDPPGSAGRVAVLTDERGVYHGAVGAAVEGRYRILSIDEASVELEDLTRGERLTLKLSAF